jgi:hypothetical protein
MNIPDDDIIGDTVTMTVTKARVVIDTAAVPDELLEAFDEAQGPVFAGEKKSTFVIIEIVPDA